MTAEEEKAKDNENSNKNMRVTNKLKDNKTIKTGKRLETDWMANSDVYNARLH